MGSDLFYGSALALGVEPPFCAISCLCRLDRALAAQPARAFRDTCEAFIEEHSNYRSLADFLIGTLVPEMKPYLEKHYGGEGKPLVELYPRKVIDKLDHVVAEHVALLASMHQPVEGDEHFKALEQTFARVGGQIWDFPRA